MSVYDYAPTIATAEISPLVRLISQSFNAAVADEQLYVQCVGLENFRGVRAAEQLIGSLALYPMAQWFGGQPVPMSGVAAVCIAPEHRGTGAAATMLTGTLQGLYQTGTPIATLYASTQRLYRKVGFEQAGTYCRLTVPTKTLTFRDRDLPMSPIDLANWQGLQPLYQQQAQQTNGNLDRHPAIWDRIVDPPHLTMYGYLIGPSEAPEGYVIFHQESGSKSQGNSLRVRDWAALTSAAYQRLWTFFADHRSLVSQIFCYGPLTHPLMALLPEQTATIDYLSRWLMRIVHVPKALSLRGYPAGLETELHLQVTDALIPENEGNWILQVAQGAGQVMAGGRGDLQVSIRGLAPLYTGLLTPQVLQSLGFLQGTPEALAIASLLFSGPEPWMPDHF